MQINAWKMECVKVLYDERDERFVMPVLIGEVGQLPNAHTGENGATEEDQRLSSTKVVSGSQLKTVTTLSGRKPSSTQTAFDSTTKEHEIILELLRNRKENDDSVENIKSV